MLMGCALVVVGSLTSCSQQSSTTEPLPNCGWDTSVADGQRALNEYLTTTDEWLHANARATPPAPASQYWMGDCPNDGTNIAPPVDEAGDSPN